MYIIEQLNDALSVAAQQVLQLSEKPELTLDPIGKGQFGDLTAKVGFLFAKQLGKKPAEVCELVAAELSKEDWVEQTEVINGYLNIKLRNSVLWNVLKEVDNSEKYGSQKDNGVRVMFEYASINPTGPMHAGHLRSAVIADSVANVFSYLGYQVHKEYYLNDTGGQAKKLVQAVYANYLQLCGESAESVDEYAGQYVKDIAAEIYAKDGAKWVENSGMYEFFRQYVVDVLLSELRADLSELGVDHDQVFSEYEMEKSGEVRKWFEWLKENNYVEEMIMDDPIAYKGAREVKPIFALKMDGLDDRVKALTKTDGSHTYLLGDIAYHANKYARGFDWAIDYFGADHADHANVLTKVLKRLFPDKKIDIKTCQIVRFEKNGVEFKMSKRAGTYVTAKDILESVGKDSIRMEMLTRTANAQLCVDVEQIMTIDENNPVFYIQYAHARCCSALDKATETSLNIEHLNNTSVRNIALAALFFPIQLKKVVGSLEAHGLFNVLLDIARLLHGLWTEGNQNESLRLSGESMLMAKVVKKLLANGMNLMGVTALQSMR